ncbi:MAG: hypothetical protein MZV64_13265 [Ignavibacteriales bacterium]|nr:hypothetical protein [Ignavibacteriales bacterium]
MPVSQAERLRVDDVLAFLDQDGAVELPASAIRCRDPVDPSRGRFRREAATRIIAGSRLPD